MDTGFITRFAATYDCRAYGADAYNSDKPCETTTTSTNTATSGGLAPTGVNIAIGITAGVLLIVVGVVLILRAHKKSTAK